MVQVFAEAGPYSWSPCNLVACTISARLFLRPSHYGLHEENQMAICAEEAEQAAHALSSDTLQKEVSQDEQTPPWCEHA